MPDKPTQIAIVGAGTIGLSFAALHLSKNLKCKVVVYDTRPDIKDYVNSRLPGYLVDADPESCMKRLSFAKTVKAAVKDADIVQEQGPEDPAFKIEIWPEIERHAPPMAGFWSSTSGIPASVQSRDMQDPTRLLVVHPYNPPHIMPLIEMVRSPETSSTALAFAQGYWRALGRTPVVVQKECTGFVANRLAFALFREACSLVAQGVVGVEDLDAIVTASMGPRWSVAGPFKAYHAGGGEGGLTGFMAKIGGTVQSCWDASAQDIARENINVGSDWQEDVCRQAQEAYGVIDTAERDRKVRNVLAAASS